MDKKWRALIAAGLAVMALTGCGRNHGAKAEEAPSTMEQVCERTPLFHQAAADTDRNLLRLLGAAYPRELLPVYPTAEIVSVMSGICQGQGD